MLEKLRFFQPNQRSDEVQLPKWPWLKMGKPPFKGRRSTTFFPPSLFLEVAALFLGGWLGWGGWHDAIWLWFALRLTGWWKDNPRKTRKDMTTQLFRREIIDKIKECVRQRYLLWLESWWNHWQWRIGFSCWINSPQQIKTTSNIPNISQTIDIFSYTTPGLKSHLFTFFPPVKVTNQGSCEFP